jgi:hypothetical protein
MKRFGSRECVGLHGKVGGYIVNQVGGTFRPLGPVPSQYIFLFFLCIPRVLLISSHLIPHDLFPLIFREKYTIMKSFVIFYILLFSLC